jgi:glycosyltransferase involved in cell wall biosynthesis
LGADRPAWDGDVRIVVLMHNFAGGGAERMFIRLANGFAGRGVAVTVVAVSADGVLQSEIAPEVRTIDLACRRTFAAIRPLREILRQLRPTALLSGLVHVNTLAVLALRGLRERPRLVLSERNTPSRDMLHSGSPMVFAAHLVMPWSYRQADAVIAVSAGVARDLARVARLGRHRITVLPNPVVADDFEARAAAALDVAWPELSNRPVLLSAGRLEPQKDFATLVRAVARLGCERPCELVILGEGVERPRLEALACELGIAERVHLPGFSKRAPAAMRRADLYVLSSRFEGSPNALVEAMAAGTPVVATDCRSGPREILRDGALGALVPVGDAAGLAGAPPISA